jgi:hypothetical protein
MTKLVEKMVKADKDEDGKEEEEWEKKEIINGKGIGWRGRKLIEKMCKKDDIWILKNEKNLSVRAGKICRQESMWVSDGKSKYILV